MIKKFRDWVSEHRPELINLLQNIQEGCHSEKELRERMSRDRDLREAFVHFALRAIKVELPQKGSKQILERWMRVFQPLEEKYKKSDNFVDDMLVLNEQKS